MRQELCLEAISRCEALCHALTENKRTDKPAVSALLALMCFYASRFVARVDTQGKIVRHNAQDYSLWD